MGILGSASDVGDKADAVFLFIFVLCAAFLVFITTLLVLFTVKYARRRHPVGRDIEGNRWLEVTWTLVPLGLFLAMFYFGWTNFMYQRSAPRDALTVKVTGRQWAWEFEYPNGRRADELILALEKPVRLEIRSADVIHGFFVPAFGIKMDAVPGATNTTWFTPTRLGAYDVECTVICGPQHSYMLSKAVVVPVEDFGAWYFGPADAPLPGRDLVAAAEGPPPDAPRAPGWEVLRRKACLACHSADGRTMVGPTFRGTFGSTTTVVLPDGTRKEVAIDEEYLKRAIRDPMAEIVKGYPPTMPRTPLTDEELRQVLDYIEGLAKPPAPKGEAK